MKRSWWNGSKNLPGRYWGALLLWCVLMGGSLLGNLWFQHTDLMEHIRFQARSVCQAEGAFWRPIHGGAYLAVPDGPEANPYLDIAQADRTLTASTGERYRMIAPPHLASQIHAHDEELSGVRIRRTSLRPLGTTHADAWETAAMKSFEEGASEVSSLDSMEGQQYLRLMRPLRSEGWCLQCHRGEEVGGVRGGISVAIPMAQALAGEPRTLARLAAIHLGLFLVGCAMILVFARRDQRHATRLADRNVELQRAVGNYERVQAQLQHEAFHDRLTGLANRALFMERVSNGLARATRRPDYAFAVLFLDLDHFKVVNDSLGHLAGDRLLILVARKLEDCLRSLDLVARPGEGSTIARLGGDEFTVFLDDIKDCTNAVRVADRIQKELATPLELDGQTLFAAASIGIAMSTSGHQQPEDVLREADTAMYRAKLAGRACHQVFDTTMHDQAVARLHLETDLRGAIERQELILHYQPIFSLQDRRIVGFEALVRWQHRRRGLMPPGEFIPLAEETGLIVSIGNWVLREACRQARRWQDQFPREEPLRVSVNLSGKEFGQTNLVEQVECALRDAGLEGCHLNLEITESEIMADAKSAIVTLGELKKLGVKLSIDDFGTGYSSLSYLRRFPVDELKIDRSFVCGIDDDPESGEIIRAITELAHSLGLGVVVEGVETAEQTDFSSTAGADWAQGFFFSKPLDRHGMERLLASAGQDLAIGAGCR